ncbi:hypothetical protein, conserved in T. vivax [Trypanosoma vivax Y486]|uniref:Uncharacterized protein n=1 Tax=Trypanosoma vivax (strain Y486) TaxID=1055687 RepID=F9WUT7_TRYVY|nr:hypothetical protein, conserved in T. vivax [Trypanosoma vivax Y486]|eukprot:CCD21336.1 hypothetical protein, conserved in T. vivax [Trypanosoma vivax Y486]
MAAESRAALVLDASVPGHLGLRSRALRPGQSRIGRPGEPLLFGTRRRVEKTTGGKAGIARQTTKQTPICKAAGVAHCDKTQKEGKTARRTGHALAVPREGEDQTVACRRRGLSWRSDAEPGTSIIPRHGVGQPVAAGRQQPATRHASPDAAAPPPRRDAHARAEQASGTRASRHVQRQRSGPKQNEGRSLSAQRAEGNRTKKRVGPTQKRQTVREHKTNETGGTKMRTKGEVGTAVRRREKRTVPGTEGSRRR